MSEVASAGAQAAAQTAGGILLATINAKWIHPSLALRLLKANLGPLENRCSIIEFALRQPIQEKIDPILAVQPRILGLSVSIWNHTATLELLKHLWKIWAAPSHEGTPEHTSRQYPFVILGGPEVSYLPPQAEIFRYADCCVIGEGEIAFRTLCEAILDNIGIGDDEKVFSKIRENLSLHGVFSEKRENFLPAIFVNQNNIVVNINKIKNAYSLYTNEDVHKKLIYVESSRGCPFSCEFCLSANSPVIREFPLEPFLMEMDALIQRGAKTFKFLDRTFNLNIGRAQRIMEFFLNKIEPQTTGDSCSTNPFVVHFEMVPSRFPLELIETIARFPAGTLRLEIGIQTLNQEVSARIGRPLDLARELETLRLLRERTNAIMHVDLIAGLPGEDMVSFGRGFDQLWGALSAAPVADTEIQLGILKLLPGAAIARHTHAFGMRYSPSPPYEVMETAAMPAADLDRIKNFARFWELIVNRNLTVYGADVDMGPSPVFDRFMVLSDSLLARFGRNWGIAKNELQEALHEMHKLYP